MNMWDPGFVVVTWINVGLYLKYLVLYISVR